MDYYHGLRFPQTWESRMRLKIVVLKSSNLDDSHTAYAISLL